MPHPCKSSEDHHSPGTAAMHACRAGYEKTLCELPVDQGWVNRVDGYTAVCSWCFPEGPERTGDRQYLQIGNRSDPE